MPSQHPDSSIRAGSDGEGEVRCSEAQACLLCVPSLPVVLFLPSKLRQELSEYRLDQMSVKIRFINSPAFPEPTERKKKKTKEEGGWRPKYHLTTDKADIEETGLYLRANPFLLMDSTVSPSAVLGRGG